MFAEAIPGVASAAGVRHETGRAMLALLLALGCSTPRFAAADTLTVLHSFDFGTANGMYPEGRLVQGPDGRFYGTTYSGGLYGYGAVFAVSGTGSFEILHSFQNTDGQGTAAGLTPFADGNFYGSTPQGVTAAGAPSGGTVYQLAPSGGFYNLHSFASNGIPDGATPVPLADGGDGYLWGATATGNPLGTGTVFKIGPDGAFATVHSFAASEGGGTTGPLTRGSDGNFYGALRYTVASLGNGAIFRITPSGVVTVLHQFNGLDGSAPSGPLTEVTSGPQAGSFYGVTLAGGPFKNGTVFRMAPDGTVTTLHAFNGNDGSQPEGGLAAGPDGNFYGLSFGGGPSGYGTIFRVTPAGELSTLRQLQPADGVHPVAGPIFGSDGLLYGATTEYGGASGAGGSVFKFDALAQQPEALSLTKYCYNEFDLCLKPINTTVGMRYSIIWSSANLASCIASGAWSGPKPSGGQLDVVPTQPGIYTYRLRCQGAAGSKSATVAVTVG